MIWKSSRFFFLKIEVFCSESREKIWGKFDSVIEGFVHLYVPESRNQNQLPGIAILLGL